MNGFSLPFLSAGVLKLNVTRTIAVFLLVGGVAHAADAADSSPGINLTYNPNPTCKANQVQVPELDASGKQIVMDIKGVSVPKLKCETDCDEAYKPVEDAQTEMTSKCTKAGLGAECITMIQKCMTLEETGAGDKSFLERLAPLAGKFGNSMFGNVANSLSSSMGKAKTPRGCGNMSAKDYQDEKAKIERELREAKNEISDLKKELVEEQKDMNKQMKEAQESAVEAQKDYNEKNSSLNKDKLEAAKKLVEEQGEQTKSIQDLNTKMTEKRSQMLNYEENFRLEMLQMSENTGKLQCLVGVKSKRDEMMKAGLFNDGAGGLDGIGQGGSQAEALKALWADCMGNFFTTRSQKTEKRKDYMQNAYSEISSIQTQIDEANSNLTSIMQRHQQAMNDLETERQNNGKSAQSKVQIAQSNVTNAQKTMQTKQQALADKQGEVNQRISSLNQDLSNLGPVPRSGAEQGWRAAQSSVMDYLNRADSFKRAYCPSDTRKELKCSGDSSRFCDRTRDQKNTDALKGLQGAEKKAADRRSRQMDRDNADGN